MNPQIQVQMNSRLSRQRNMLLLATGILLCSNVMLSVFVLSKDQRTIVVPMNIRKSFEIGKTEVSQEYIELIARDLVQNILNITPDNHEYVKNAVLKLAHPGFYGELKQQLDELTQDVKTRQISIHYRPMEMKIEGLVAEVSGYLETRVGLKEISKEIRKYRLGFNYTGFGLTLKEFYEVRDEKKSE